jgi:hypothetical protein
MGHVLTLHEQVDIARCRIEVTASRRTEHVEPADAVLPAQVDELLSMAFEHLGHHGVLLAFPVRAQRVDRVETRVAVLGYQLRPDVLAPVRARLFALADTVKIVEDWYVPTR